MTSVRNEIIAAVSRTVSPWASCDVDSSSSSVIRPSRLHPERKAYRVRVDLSRKIEMPSPVSNTRVEMPAAASPSRISAARSTPRIASSRYCHVRRKSLS